MSGLTNLVWQRRIALGTFAIATVLAPVPLKGATTTDTFTVQITITPSCSITSTATLDFGTNGMLLSNVDQTTTLDVQCTDTTPYDVGLDAGTGGGATVANRLMANGGNTVTYSLYQDGAYSTVWGETVGVDTVSAIGNGGAQTYTVYGRVPAQTTPAPNTYTDTITVTVTY